MTKTNNPLLSIADLLLWMKSKKSLWIVFILIFTAIFFVSGRNKMSTIRGEIVFRNVDLDSTLFIDYLREVLESKTVSDFLGKTSIAGINDARGVVNVSSTLPKSQGLTRASEWAASELLPLVYEVRLGDVMSYSKRLISARLTRMRQQFVDLQDRIALLAPNTLGAGSSSVNAAPLNAGQTVQALVRYKVVLAGSNGALENFVRLDALDKDARIVLFRRAIPLLTQLKNQSPLTTDDLQWLRANHSAIWAEESTPVTMDTPKFRGPNLMVLLKLIAFSGALAMSMTLLVGFFTWKRSP